MEKHYVFHKYWKPNFCVRNENNSYKYYYLSIQMYSTRNIQSGHFQLKEKTNMYIFTSSIKCFVQIHLQKSFTVDFSDNEEGCRVFLQQILRCKFESWPLAPPTPPLPCYLFLSGLNETMHYSTRDKNLHLENALILTTALPFVFHLFKRLSAVFY